MVKVPIDNDEYYPVYFYDKYRATRWVTTTLDMTNAEFVQMVMLHERWCRMQADLTDRAGYYR